MASVSKREWTYKGETKTAWIVRYQSGGKHRQKTFERKKEADAYRNRIASEIVEGVADPGGAAVTVDKVIDEYLLTRKRLATDGVIARSTYERELFHLAGHAAPLIGKVKLRDLSVHIADQFISDLRQTKKRNKKGKLAGSTVKKITSTLACAIDLAKRRKLIGLNVLREVSSWPEHRSAGTPKIRTFEPDEVRRLVASLETRRKWQMQRSVTLGRAMVYLAAFCGLRFGEICGLTLENVDFTRKLILVRHSMDRWGNLKGPKTKAGVRDIPMPTVVENAMRTWLILRTPNKHNLVFTTKIGGEMTREPFHRDIWRPMLDACGLGADEKGRRFHFHALRHFFASMLIQGRMSLTDTAHLMGHSKFDMTLQIYAHPIVDADWRRETLSKIAIDITPTSPVIAQEFRTGI